MPLAYIVVTKSLLALGMYLKKLPFVMFPTLLDMTVLLRMVTVMVFQSISSNYTTITLRSSGTDELYFIGYSEITIRCNRYYI